MANYYASTRTNYFRVKDPDAFREFMKTVEASDDGVHLWEEEGKDGEVLFGFGCYGSICGVRQKNPDDDECEFDDGECDYEEFVNGLSDHVAKGDAVIVMESGSEKLRYIVGSALIVTSSDSDFLDIEQMACARAAEMLGNKDWKTKTCY